jgi:hypothetical protein
MICKIKNNKWPILILLVFYIALVFCHLQTFVINDDLPYSLYFRVDNRITDLKGVVINQIFDYSHISPRVFIHFIVQSLLIFNKTLWSFVNPLIIVGIVILMSYILYNITGKKGKPLYFVLASIVAFLLLYNYKYLVYWVAGSVNYVWVFLVLLLFLLYYFKIGFEKKPVLTFIICLFTSILCEVASIFVIVFLICDLFVKLFIEKSDKKIIIKYFFYLLGSIGGFLFLMLAPSNIGRMAGSDEFSGYSILDKLMIAIPVISTYTFNGFNLYMMYFMYIKNLKGKYVYSVLIFLVFVFALLFNNGWLFFLLAIALLCLQIYILIINKDFHLIGILLGAYAVLYALAITPDYYACRTGFHTSLIIALFTIYNFVYYKDISKLFKVIICLLCVITIILEIVIYNYIGSVKKQREESLNDVISGKTNVLEFKLIKTPYVKFHIDANSPTDKSYWAYAAFEDYYKLPENIEFKIIK